MDQIDHEKTLLNLAKDRIVLYLSTIVFVFALIIAIFFSIIVALVVLAAYAAGLLAPYLIFREGKHVPNMLVLFLGEEANTVSNPRDRKRSCSTCNSEQCSRQLPPSLTGTIPGPHHPHTHITVPRCVDEALEELLNLVLDEHVYIWYREFSVHDQLADEIRYVIRYACCVLYARLQEVDLTHVITDRLLPTITSHLDQYVEGGRRVRVVGGLEAGVLEYCKKAGWLHPAMHSREAEANYLRSLISTLKPYLLPNKYQSSSVAECFLRELLGRFLLLQLMDFFADPDTLNLLFLVLLKPDYLHKQQDGRQMSQSFLSQQQPTPQHSPQQKQAPVTSLTNTSQQPPQDGESEIKDVSVPRSDRDLEQVILLKNFATVNTHPRNSSLRNNLSAILKDQTLLYLFHTFLKEESAINILQFCLAVEDFNRHILDPELSAGELEQLHSQALDLYHMYMAPGAPDGLPFPEEVVTQIRDMVHSEASAIVKLRTTRPLFQAYENAYNLLEREYLPHFLNSHMYFAHLCGSRSSQTYQKTSSRVSPVLERTTQLQRSSSSTRLRHTRSASEGGAINPRNTSTTQSVAAAGGGAGVSRGGVVGSVGRSLRTLGAQAQMVFKTQVVAGDDLNSLIQSVGYSQDEQGEDCCQLMLEEGTPTGGLGSAPGLEGLASGSYRDLSAWRVTIPRLDYVPDPNCPTKMTYFFVIDVTRIDVSGETENTEDTHWEVLRRFHEFYILESKLTEFHGEFQYNTLPSRRSLFTSTHASDFMMTRRQIFEEYLQKLLQTPALRKSQLLFLFLKSKDEFTSSFLPDVSLGKLLRDVPRKLVKEKGQHLEPFIGHFLRAAQAEPVNKSGQDQHLEEAVEASEALSSELYPLLSSLYEDNARSLPLAPALHSIPLPPLPAQFVASGIIETLMYIGVRVYSIALPAVRWLVAFNAVVGSTLDAALVWFIRKKLTTAITPRRIIKLIHILKEALIEVTPERNNPAKRKRELELRSAALTMLPPWLTRLVVDDDSYKEGSNTIVNVFQHPLLNKQLTYVLLDQVLEELFPEITEHSEPK